MTEETITPSVTPTQACVILGVSFEALQALVFTGKLREDRIDGLVRFTHEAISECIEKLSKEWRQVG